MKKQIYALFTKRQKSKFRFGKNKKFTILNNRYFVKFNIQGLFVLFALFLAVYSHGQSLEIISPNGGENWLRETDQTMRWTYHNPNSYYLYLEYSSNGGQSWNNIGYVPNEDVN
ncbi:MAG: hypothetical protein U5Q03_01035 [Bacteroidota bacterium]|nr:hypothetical protein [Bacteroidota bacterium]